MKIYAQFKKYLFSRFEGTTAIEYTLVAAGIAVAVAGAIFLMGDSMLDLYTFVGMEIANAVARR